MLIMKQADLMQYDDDFDEEDFFDGKGGKKYAVKFTGNTKGENVVMGKKNKNKRAKDKEETKQIVPENISEIAKASDDGNLNAQDDLEDDDDIDIMAKFIEGQDIELVKDHSASF